MVVTMDKFKIVFTLAIFNLLFIGCAESTKTVFTADKDAKNWEKEDVSLPVALSNSGAVSFKGSLYQVSGSDAKKVLKLEGKNWVEVGKVPNISSGHSVVVFKDKMYLIGGLSEMGISKKVYSSSDGVSWVESGALPGHRTNGKAIVFKEKMFYYGGVSSYDIDTLEAQSEKTIFVSEDGVSWNTAGYLPNETGGMSIENYNCESLIMVGGVYSNAKLKSEGPYSSVFTSTDGVTWEYLSNFSNAAVGGSLISL